MAETTPDTVVYVSNAGSKDIHVLAMDRATGELRLIDKTPVPGTDRPSPSSLPMAVDPSGGFLYAQLRSPPYPVSSFSIDRSSGRLQHLGTTPLIDQMAYIRVDRAGRHLLGASYVGAKVASYPIDARHVVDGRATQIIDTGPKAHCIVIDAANAHAYVPVLGADEILQFEFDAKTGRLRPTDPPAIATAGGAGPRHLTIAPNGRRAYLITETTATIGAYAIDRDNGILTELAFVDTGDHTGAASAAASDIHVTPDGRHLYGAVRTTSTLHGYAIDPETGRLRPIDKWPTEKTPRGFAIDSRGRFLLSVGMDSAAMTVHSIDAATGALNPVGKYPMGTQPNWVEIIDLT